MKTIRFLPLVALAAFSLLALKMAGLLMGEGYMVTGSRPSLAKAIPDAPQAETGKEKKNGKKGKSDDVSSLAAKRIGAKKSVPKDITSLISDDHRTKAEVILLTSLSKTA